MFAARPSHLDFALPLAIGELQRSIAFDGGQSLSLADFLAHVHGLAPLLDGDGPVLNLCEGRYRFMLSYCAALLRGRATLLPPSRAPTVILEMLERYPEATAIGDDAYADGIHLPRRPPRYLSLPQPLPRATGERPMLRANLLAAIGFTSGSSGPPQAQPKRWGAFSASTARNLEVLLAHAGGPCHVLATVPSQHMYGMETAVLLPLLGAVSIHGARPFFPADIAQALHELPEPRVLVTTPVHLRALIESGLSLPRLNVILSATAPLSAELARAAERATGAQVLEFFGSTETCVIGYRRTALAPLWTPHQSVRIEPRGTDSLIHADWLAEPVLLHDMIEVTDDGRFHLAGRASEHLEIAGKRVALGELTRRLLAIDGVQDGVVFQLEGSGPVARIAALAVAPERSEADLLDALRETIDPVFLPRPLRLVACLPRNETGKLPRAALLAALRDG